MTEKDIKDVMEINSDNLQKFMIENASVRGELVELSDTWKQVLALREYPPAVVTLLGEMMAAAALLSANLKFNGVIVMQIHGDGPIRLLVVECDGKLQMRATAKLVPDAVVEDTATLAELLNVNGHGRFAITLDPQDKMPGQQPYQGIVPLDGDNVAEVIENYMLRSEQLDTKLWLAADGNISRGLLLQKLPNHGGVGITEEDPLESWNRVAMLGATLRPAEMLSTDIQTLLRRLFWEETVRVFEPQHPRFVCNCSREKVGNMLQMLGQKEVDEAIEELGKVSVDCDFCGQNYAFDQVDCAHLFTTSARAETLLGTGDIKH
ncbi:Hsp33 family molecular chaperone HslO [Glaciimonas immobilis]|uniref:Molecular chaperone Hsp33 n=1 Tax=Glaciimonas immobilis TaxID=728004 RepID=A0A840S1Q9_9BURK|nr:Hsp33 family molecular chaperone HslO [Glaciimonas immobilis]KAF3996656.1 Hsp33 family molecular chaperone HslO [Glaciimonas immobilis]MBB5202499.1 molecular chaperone Hsp33 [Glaciimonas immobilis]